MTELRMPNLDEVDDTLLDLSTLTLQAKTAQCATNHLRQSRVAART